MVLLTQLFLAGSAQGLLLCVVILSIPSNRLANRLLALYVGLESLHLLYLHITYFDVSQPPDAFLRFLFGVRALSGPALYLYARALTDPSFRLEPGLLRHLWVLLFSIGWFSILIADPTWATRSTAELWSMPSTALLAIYQSLIMGGYALAAWYRLQDHQLRLHHALSAVDHVSLDWLQRLMVALIAVTVLHLGVEGLRLLEWVEPLVKATMNLSVTMLLIYLISIGGLRQPQVFSDGLRTALAALEEDPVVESVTQSDPVTTDIERKYRKSGLDDTRRHSIWQQLQTLFEHERTYLEPGLDLPSLAEQLAVRPQELSEVINTVYGGTFYQLINERRISAAQALLRNPAEAGRKMLDIALSVGFNSQSTFYSQFRKLTGVTPTTYRQQYQSDQTSSLTRDSGTRRTVG